jgi:hypothetical protein
MARASSPRDPRLDFFRGIAMFIILIAHIPRNPWTAWIPARFGFSDATEIFVFCSGMASALAFGAIFARAGWLMGALRIAHRVWQVYWVHLGVFFTTLTLMLVINATGRFPRDEVGALNLYPFLDNTGPNLVGLLTLTYVPNYFDILPMYLVILALIPVVMALARIDTRLVAVLCLTLWAAATAGLLRLPAEFWFDNGSTRAWFFNPFAWQLVFFTGFALMAGWLPAPPVRPWLVWLAIAIAVLSIPFAWSRIHSQVEMLGNWRDDWRFLFSKTNFGILRYLHFLAIAYLAWVAVGPGGARLLQGGASGRVVAIVSSVGQQSLAVFAASMVLARVLGAFLSLAGGGWLAALVINVTGMIAIIAVARLVALVKSEPWRQSRPPATAATAPVNGDPIGTTGGVRP